MINTFSYQSAYISYQVIGQGMPVLLIHGFGEDSRVWTHQVSYLKDKFQLILPDLPGSGASPANDEIASSIDAMADCMIALANSITQEKVAVIGHSMGGYIAFAIAEKAPEKLRGLGLVHSTASADSEQKKETRRKGIASIRKNGGYPFMAAAIPNLFAAQFKSEHPKQVEELIEQSKAFADSTLTAYYNAMIARPDRTVLLSSLQMPVLYILGEQDKAVPLTDVLKQVHLPMVSDVHILQNTVHMGMWEATGQTNSYLFNYLHQLEEDNI